MTDCIARTKLTCSREDNQQYEDFSRVVQFPGGTILHLEQRGSKDNLHIEKVS